MLIVQIIINGLVIGSTFVLVAMGFTLIFGVMGVMNVAQADFYMLGAFSLLWLGVSAHLPMLVVVLLAMASGLVIGALYYYLVLRQIGEGQFLAAFVASVGVSYFIENLVTSLLGSAPEAVPSFVTNQHLGFSGLSISVAQLLLIGGTVLVAVVLLLVLSRSSLGRDIRAVAESRVLAASVGIDPMRTSMIAVLIASVVATIGGVLVTGTTLTVSPFSGGDVILPMFVVAIVAGAGSVGGAAVAGFLLGVVESFTVQFVGSGWQSVVGLAVLVVVLLFRPQGIFGRAVRVG